MLFSQERLLEMQGRHVAQKEEKRGDVVEKEKERGEKKRQREIRQQKAAYPDAAARGSLCDPLSLLASERATTSLL